MDNKDKLKTKMHEQNISDKEALTKGFSENLGIFLLGGTKYRNSTITWIHSVFFTGLSSFLIYCLCRTVLLLLDDMTTLFETLHWTIILMTVLAGFPSSFPNMARYDHVFTSFGRGVYTYVEADDETTKKIEKLRDTGEKEKKLLVKIFSSMLLSTYCCFVVLLPIYSMYTGQFFEPPRSDGIITGIPCIIWLPAQFEQNNIVLVRIVMMLIEGYVSGTIIFVVIAEQGTSICIGHKLLYEFKVLALAVKKFDQRASGLHKRERKTRNQQRGTDAFLRQCFKESVIHHKILVSIAENYSDIFFVHQLSLLSASTLLICLSAISLVSDIPVAAKIISMIFTGAELGNVFVGCFYGQVLLDSHQLVASALYDSNWTKCSRLIGKHVSIMLSRLQRPLSLTAGGFAEVNLDTYAQVVKSSFSYFSLLRAMKEST